MNKKALLNSTDEQEGPTEIAQMNKKGSTEIAQMNKPNRNQTNQTTAATRQ